MKGDRLAPLDQFDLTGDLILDGSAEVADGVEVLHLDLGKEFGRAGRRSRWRGRLLLHSLDLFQGRVLFLSSHLR